MERTITKVKDYIKMDKIKDYISSPYVAGFIGILVVIYASFLANKLPEKVARWFNNPLFKIVFMFVILMAHKINPVLAIVLAVVFIISLWTLTQYTTIKMVKTHQYLVPEPQEELQMKQEVSDEIRQRQMEKSDPVEDHAPIEEGLHPKNRPTTETLYRDNSIEDPNDPRQPGLMILNDPKVDTAIYELNPPFAQKSTIGGEEVNKSNIKLPEGGATRYCAVHGYKLA
jgi:hypothetical protein